MQHSGDVLKLLLWACRHGASFFTHQTTLSGVVLHGVRFYHREKGHTVAVVEVVGGSATEETFSCLWDRLSAEYEHLNPSLTVPMPYAKGLVPPTPLDWKPTA